LTILGTPLAIAPAANKRIIALADKMILLATSQPSPFPPITQQCDPKLRVISKRQYLCQINKPLILINYCLKRAFGREELA
jgi:hypothetical protein